MFNNSDFPFYLLPSVGPYIVKGDGDTARTNIIGVPDAAGSSGAGGASSIIARSTTDNVVNNTAAEANLFTFTLSANTLTTNGILRVTARISSLNNLGAGAGTWTFKCYYGATSITISVLVGNSTTAPAWIRFIIMGAGATNAQDLGAELQQSNGAGNVAVGTAAIDSTSDQTVKITVTMPAAHALLGCTLWNYDAILFD